MIDHIDAYIFDGDYLLIAEDGENLRSRKLPLVTQASGKFWVNNHAHIAQARHSIMEQEFLYYVLNDLDVRSYVTGTAQPKLSQANLLQIPIPVPPRSRQRRIASTLSNYDDLIENNTRRIRVLEEMARSLYRDCSREGARAAAASLQKLSSIVALEKSGIVPNAEPDITFDLLSFEACDLGRIPLPTPGSAIQSNKFRVPDNCVLLPKLNPHIPRVWMPFLRADRPAICSTEYLVLVPKPNIPRALIYALVEDPSFLGELAVRADGTSNSHKRLKPDDVMARPIVVPSLEALARFGTQAEPLYAQCDVLQRRNRTLRATRDLLLPRLLSGQLDVSHLPDPDSITLPASEDAWDRSPPPSSLSKTRSAPTSPPSVGE